MHYQLLHNQSVIKFLERFATETVDSGFNPGRVKLNTMKMKEFTAFLLNVQQYKGHCEASTKRGKQLGRWQFYSMTEKSLHCFQPSQLGE